MTVSGIGATSAIAALQPAPKTGLRQQVNALFKDVQSGNLQAAKSDYSALAQLLGTGASGGSAGDPFSLLLNQVGSALSSGDITGAQSALSDFQTQGVSQAAAQAQSADAVSPHHRHHGSGGAANQAGLSSLISAIQGGDLGGAQQAYASLTDGNGDDTGSGTTVSGAAGASSASRAANAASTGVAGGKGSSGSDMFSQLMAELGASLANSDIAAAQQSLTSFAQTQKVGSVVNVAA